MMLPLISHLLCLFIVWPALLLRFNAPRRPARRPIARQWAAIGQLGPRVVGVRLQLVVL